MKDMMGVTELVVTVVVCERGCLFTRTMMQTKTTSTDTM